MTPRPPVPSPSSSSFVRRRLPAGWRLPVALAAYMLFSTGILGAIALHLVEHRLHEHDVQLGEMMHELERRELARHALEASLTELRRTLDTRELQLQQASRETQRLALALAQTDAERRALEDERNLAREHATLVDRGARDAERWLDTAQRERRTLERDRAALEERLKAAQAARDAALRRAASLRASLQANEQRVAALEAEREATARWLTARIDDRLGAIETVFERTGIESDRLLLSVTGRAASGQGGPLLPPSPMPSAQPVGQPPEPGIGASTSEAGHLPLITSMAGDLDRLEAAERLLTMVPLATPFDHFHLTSAFGERIDPLTRRRAHHNGIDFGAPPGSRVLSTAPGRVTHAGWAGSYGNMVEIDHGYGIVTRYAHLSRTLVEVGDRVALRAPLGVIGSTGRSTGRHLHYEVHLDGVPRDPARFIAAGRELIEAIGS